MPGKESGVEAGEDAGTCGDESRELESAAHFEDG